MLAALLALVAAASRRPARGAHSLVRVGRRAGLLHLGRRDLAEHARRCGRPAGESSSATPTVDGGMRPRPLPPGEVTPTPTPTSSQVVLPAAPASRRVRVDLGEREDSRDGRRSPLPVTLLGGPGADQLTAGPAADERRRAATATTASPAAPGDDVLAGGAGRRRARRRRRRRPHAQRATGWPTDRAAAPGADRVDADDGRRRWPPTARRVTRTAVAAAARTPTADDGRPPVVDAGAPTLQRVGALAAGCASYATSSEPRHRSAPPASSRRRA